MKFTLEKKRKKVPVSFKADPDVKDLLQILADKNQQGAFINDLVRKSDLFQQHLKEKKDETKG